MVDREARDQFAELVRHLANGRITEKHFDEAVEKLPCSGKDLVFAAIFEETYDIETAARRDVAQWILFLKSEAEYEWPGMEELLNPFEVIGAVALCLMLASFFHSASIAWWTTLAIVVFGKAICHWRGPKNRKPGDLKAWPFHKQTDLEEAMRHPHLLNGTIQ